MIYNPGDKTNQLVSTCHISSSKCRLSWNFKTLYFYLRYYLGKKPSL